MFANFHIKRIIMGSVSGTAVTAALLLAGAAVLCYTGLPGSTAELFVIIATIAGIFTGGIVASCGVSGFGWLQGGSSGFLYTLILFLISLFSCGFSGVFHMLMTFLIGFVAGAAGGITGININSKKNFKKKRKNY